MGGHPSGMYDGRRRTWRDDDGHKPWNYGKVSRSKITNVSFQNGETKRRKKDGCSFQHGRRKAMRKHLNNKQKIAFTQNSARRLKAMTRELRKRIY